MISAKKYKRKPNCIYIYNIVPTIIESLEVNPPMKWTQREIRWYLNEDRLLFGSDNELLIHKWSLLLQWLIQQNIKE